jgi:DNA-binding GntR family transcriptional regulator
MDQLVNTELSTREHVYAQIKTQILRGELRNGTKLREIPLSQCLGVSRTPVREAVQQLAKDGLVSIEAFKGAWVSSLDASEIDAIYTVRECLDGLAALLAACHRTKSDLQQIRSALVRMEMAHMGAYPEQIQADLAFHAAIAKASQNEFLVQTLAGLADRVTQVRLVAQEFTQCQQSKEGHHRIFNAIEAQLPVQAEAAAKDHVRAFRVLIIDLLSK